MSTVVRVWIDAQLPPGLAPKLESTFGIEARHIFELGFVQARDLTIFRAAGAASAIVITKDSDFVRLLEAHGPPPQVLWITIGNAGNEELWDLLERHWLSIRKLLEAGEPLVEIGRSA